MVAAARRIERLDRLERIIQTQSLLVQADLALNPFMQLVVDKLRELTQADGVAVELLEGDRLVCRRASGAAGGWLGMPIAARGTLAGLCLRTAAVQRCNDTELDERVDVETCRRKGQRSLICAPLRQAGGTVGVLKVHSGVPHAFDDGDVQMLQLMASAIVAALARKAALDARTEAEARLRDSEERMRSLLEYAHDAVVSIDERGCVSQWNRAAERLFGWSPIETLGQPVAELIVPPAQRVEFARVVAGYAAAERLEDAQQRTTVQAVDRAGRELAVEVSLTATRVAGRWELTAFGHDVTERRRLEGRLREMALSDGLTGLANRRAFMETLEKAVSRHARGGPPMALLFLDLDGFKQINDHFGHHVGDLALQAFARRLEACVRKGDTIARLGGDEFTVLAEGIATLDQARAIADKIVAAMAPSVEGCGLHLRASIGMSLYRAPADASQFLREADHAMYHAKQHRDEVRGISAFMGAEMLQ
jgi:diguanylate cyclase (GGDEF)-like protein/PAS domain S-box-containing protein